MKTVHRYILFALCALMLFGLRAPASRADAPFILDETHVYDGMERAYAQGYTPQIAADFAYVVLPLLSDACTGDVTAEFIASDVRSSPVKLGAPIRQTVKRKTYTFSKQKVEAYRVAFKLALHAARENGEYPYEVLVTGKDKAGGALTRRFAGVLRVRDGLESARIPALAIESFDAGALEVGGRGELQLMIANQSHTRELRELQLTLAEAKGDILPVGSDTVRIESLAPRESVRLGVPVDVLASASAEPHALSLTIEYRYGESGRGSFTEKRGVNVGQRVRMEHSEAALPVRVVQGDNTAFAITLMNMGKGAFYNALLTFDVPHLSGGGSVLAGKIEPGESKQVSANLRVASDYAGDARGTLTLTWEDGYGAGYSKQLPLSTVIEARTVPVPEGVGARDSRAAASSKMGAREIAAWSAAAAFAVALCAYAITSAKKIRKLEEKSL